MKITPKVHRVLIKQDKIEDKYGKNSLIVRAGSEVKKEQQAAVSGTVVAVGRYAWNEYPEERCEVGDRVLFQRYSGMKIPDGMGGFLEEGLLILLNDLDVTGRIINDEGEALDA